MALPTFGFGAMNGTTSLPLVSGETYTLNVQGKPNAHYFKVTFEDILVSSLVDADGNGTYQGVFTIAPSVQAAQTQAGLATHKLGLVLEDGSVEGNYSSVINTASAGTIRDRSTGNPLANASVAALIAQTNESGESFFTAWLAAQSGQGNPQVTGVDGQYSYNADSGVYRLDVTRSGYQPYRSDNIDAGAGALNKDIGLTPVINDAATQKIYITASGFQPAVVKVAAGAVIEFINMDLVDHAATGSSFDSGVLTPGTGYKVKLTGGSHSYTDGAGASNGGVITIDGGRSVFMPMLAR